MNVSWSHLSSVLHVPLTALLLSTASAADYPANLPSDAQARAALSVAQSVVAAHEQQSIGKATQRKFSAGPHEWEVGALSQRRTDVSGLAYTEQEYSLGRAWRIPGKGTLDRAMGRQAAANGDYAYADGWHEGARLLLAGWFEWQRAVFASRLRSQQLELLQQQLATVTRRVTAGDAPRIEQQLAEAELARARAVQLEAEQGAANAALQLQQEFPALELQLPATIGLPQPLAADDADWIQRIIDENHEIELAEGLATLARLNATRTGRDRLADPRLGVIYSNNLDGNRQVLGLQFSMPIGGVARSAAQALARSEATIAGSEARAARARVEADARHDVVNRRSSYEQWQQLTQVADQSGRNAEIVARGYALGEFGIAELLNARRAALDAQLAADSARLTALQAHARLLLDAHQLWALDESADSDAK